MSTGTPSVDELLAGKVVGIVGGTGPHGRGLATRFAASGLKVLIDSRDAHRAAGAAETIGLGVDGDINREVARRADWYS